jgi:hypothetical protein
VFAWDPHRVLVQTGRRDEAWELVFHRDRRFEKHAVDMPFEGTTVRLFRPGPAATREGIAEAVYDSLWRWCRFCPVEITFDDTEDSEPPRLVQDAPVPEDAVVTATRHRGETDIRVAFAVPPHAALLRNGLLLAEGGPRFHLPHVAHMLGSTLDHLRVWIDSPRLQTTLARDRVVDDAGREALEREVVGLVGELRSGLLAQVEQWVDAEHAWTTAAHDRLAYLQAHLALEVPAMGEALASRPLLRSAAGRAVSAQTLAGWATTAWVAVVPPEPLSPFGAALQMEARRMGVPAVVGRWPEDRAWLEGLLATAGLRCGALCEVVTRVEPVETGATLVGEITRLLERFGLKGLSVRVGTLVDAPRSSVCAIGSGSVALAAVPLPAAAFGKLRDPIAWLDARHPLVQHAIALHPRWPRLAAFVLATAVVAVLDEVADLDALATVLDQLHR